MRYLHVGLAALAILTFALCSSCRRSDTSTQQTALSANPPTTHGYQCFCICNSEPRERNMGCLKEEGQECSPGCFPPSDCRGEIRQNDNCPPIRPRPGHTVTPPEDFCSKALNLRPTAFLENAPQTQGRYQIKSLGTDHGAEICIEVRGDDQSDSGRFQQQDCRNNGQTAFTIVPNSDSHTYSIKTFVGRYAIQHQPENNHDEILGFGADQIPADCAYRVAQSRWVLTPVEGRRNAFRIHNQATGDCLRVADGDGNNIERQGRISVYRCTNNDFDSWFLIPLR